MSHMCVGMATDSPTLARLIVSTLTLIVHI